MAFNNDPSTAQYRVSVLEWAKQFVAKQRERSHGNSGSDEGSAIDITKWLSCKHANSQECSSLEKLNGRNANKDNVSQNEPAYQQDDNYQKYNQNYQNNDHQRDNHGYQNYCKRNDDVWSDEKKENVVGYLNDRTYQNNNITYSGGYHQATSNINRSNHNAPDIGLIFLFVI
ncbi:probable ATP-dependent RNA helicase ddx42 [Phymastichus coffea]|uniref:probable ATP-dependent RNA helicase ddx42 n=1 Tax=Phymastichus coffea TaxID=108790 RepID=UPI00273BC497|nr:probable ATP-dependent RNA helicase ddx42 [Phymastichus coffea]